MDISAYSQLLFLYELEAGLCYFAFYFNIHYLALWFIIRQSRVYKQEKAVLDDKPYHKLWYLIYF